MRNLWKLWNLKFFIFNLAQNKKFLVVKIKNLLLLSQLKRLVADFDPESKAAPKTLDFKVDFKVTSSQKRHKKSLFKGNKKKSVSFRKSSNLRSGFKRPIDRASEISKDKNLQKLQDLVEKMNIYQWEQRKPGRRRKTSKYIKQKLMGSFLRQRDYHSQYVLLLLKCARKTKHEFEVIKDEFLKQQLVPVKDSESHVQKGLSKAVVIIDKFLFFERLLGRP